MSVAETYGLPGEPLTQNFCVFVDEEVLDGISVTLPTGRLRERPASG